MRLTSDPFSALYIPPAPVGSNGDADQIESALNDPNYSDAPGAPPEKKKVLIGTDEHRVTDEVVKALAADPELFHRGGMLVRIIRDGSKEDGITRPVGAPTIASAPLPWLRERITRHVALAKSIHQREIEIEAPAHPPQWLAPAVASRGDWPTLRRLIAISDAPVLRADGSIHQTPGHDPVTGVLYDPSGAFPQVPESLSRDDARSSAERLLEVVCDFRFERDEHRAAWLAAALTPLARHAFTGPAPAFLIDANIRGAGKGLSAQTIANIVAGRDMPVCGYIHDSREFEKRITSIAMSGDSQVLLDNLTGVFGNEALDRALTATRWKDRLLGSNQMVDLPLVTVFYATGNNVSVAADTARRLIHIRLDVLEEKPEERAGFRYPNLLAWVRKNRRTLLADAITVVAAYCRAGKPDQRLTPFGSFEGWSSLVRSAVVWAGLADPCLTRAQLAEQSDTTFDVLSQVHAAWRIYDPAGNGIVIAELIEHLYPREFQPVGPDAIAMRGALESLAEVRQAGKAPTARTVGNRLSTIRRRVLGNAFLDTDANRKTKRGVIWRLFEVTHG